MPRYPNRQQIVARATQARRPARSGGTTAPRAAAGGSRMGVGQRRPVRKRAGVGGGTGAGGAPGSGGSAGAMAPTAAPLTPWSTKAEQIVAGARKSYLGAGIGFDLAEKQVKQEFGLEGSSGPQKGGPDYSDYKTNPYSRAAALQESYLNANRGTINSAGLQLYSGSTSNQLGANRSTYGRSRDELAKAYRDALGEISAGRAKAAEEKAEKELEAKWEAIAAAEGAPLPPGGSGGKVWKGQAPKGKGVGTIKPPKKGRR